MDMYIYFALRKSIQDNKWKPILNTVYLATVILGYIGFYYLYFYFTSKPLQVEWAPNFAIGFFFSIMIVKIVMVFFFLFEDIFRFIELLVAIFKKFLSSDHERISGSGRRSFVRKTGLIIAAIPFSSMLYGITKGKYDFRLNEVKLSFKNLPKAFEGFKIVQISDIHSGSFDSREAIIEGIELVNKPGCRSDTFYW